MVMAGIFHTNQNIRDVFGVSDAYDIVYIQGGASMQFAMIPMNFLHKPAYRMQEP